MGRLKSKELYADLPYSIQNEIELYVKKNRIPKKKQKEIIQKIKDIYQASLYEDKEAIGVVAAQSLSEPATQMSTSGNEKIIVKFGEEVKILKIGDFVNESIEKFGFKKIGGHEVCDLPNDINVFALSLNQDEKVKWKSILSCIRHKTPEKLMQIKTNSGREIVATDFHSFVTRKDNSIIPVAGKELKVGDRIPVIKYLPENCTENLNITDFISNPADKMLHTMRLNNTFGFFTGAYLSEGSCSNGQVSISNINEDFQSNIRKFSKMLGLSYRKRMYKGAFGPSCSFVINSSLLSNFMKNTCGKGSKNKKVPDFAFSASEKFVSSLLRGYFDGDGSISINRKMIRVHSNSEELIDGIKLLLTRFEIFAYKCKDRKQFYLLIPYKYAPVFLSKIGSDIEEKRKRLMKLSELARRFWHGKSQDFTDMISGFGDIFYQIAKKLKYPTRYVNNFTKRQKIGRTALYRYIKLFEKIARERNVNIGKELGILKRMFNSDVVWDGIVEISFVKPPSEYVYDISVKGLETFATFDGIITHNTMRTYHFAGTAGIQVTLGLPRILEIFDARKEPTTPTMTVYLLPKYQSLKKAKQVAEEIREVKLRDVVISDIVDLTNLEIICKLDLERLKKLNLKPKDIEKQIKLKNVKIKVKRSEIIAVSTILDIKNFHKLKYRLLESHIKGIKDVTQAVMNKKGREWVINTLGSNLRKTLEIKGVDATRTFSNNIFEVMDIFGIEAARNVIIKQAMYTLEEQGLEVDIRYIMLLADLMTVSSTIRAIGRYGVAGEKMSVLARAAFEETKKHLTSASIKGEKDKLKGVVENIMMNQVAPIGTGAFELIGKIPEVKKVKGK